MAPAVTVSFGQAEDEHNGKRIIRMTPARIPLDLQLRLDSISGTPSTFMKIFPL